MKIIDKRPNIAKARAYELGRIYEGDGFVYMPVQYLEHGFQLISLDDGKAITGPEQTLKDLYLKNYRNDDRLINAELVIKDGVSQ